jgi:hypothetical protein
MTAYVNISEAAALYGVSRRTIEKKIASGEVHASQVEKQGRNTNISFVELLRVFGEPKNQPKGQQTAKIEPKPDMRTHAKTTEKPHANDELVALLKDQLAKAEARADRAEAEREKILGQYIAANETMRLLTAPKTEETAPAKPWWKIGR